MDTPRGVLVLRFGAVGDVILTAPAIEALHRAWPETRLVFAVKAPLAPLLEGNPYLHAVLPLRSGEGVGSLRRRARELGCDSVLDLHGKVRSKLLRWSWPSARSAVWHKREFWKNLPVQLGLRPYRASMFVADRYHAAVEALVGRPLPKGKLQYFLGPGHQAQADAVLQRFGWKAGAPLLGLAPGANWQTKRWPAERFADLARRAREAGLQVAVTGSAEERALGEEVTATAPGALNLCGELDLRAVGGFLQRCTAFVANDSGLMHLARGLGVPTLAIFGSTDPGMFDFTGHRALFAGVPCSPCSFYGRRRCPQGHFRCMLDLSSEGAWAALAPLLRGERRPLLSA